ncbi:hypothetical protein ABIB42_004424 [Massilia sp. UYP32]|jgi:hypothetical protein|uniref:DUF4148 domain-containing protein n=1 Tax=Massilia timonae CCUG 45783 TaxID=883126 RepID=K9DYB1_9BURK|nr:hypothetical protein [Massilia timonae]EKU82250.1 hypothetical protein HMPREF9710_02561 [Massilia timonae CCUG 45783]
MNAKSFIAAAALFVSAATAFAADNADADAKTNTAITGASAAASASASKLNLPAVSAPSRISRDEVRAEAVEAVKKYKPTLAGQLDQYKN